MGRTDAARGARVLAAASSFALALVLAIPRFVVAAETDAPKPVDADALVRAALEAPKHISYVGQFQTIRWGTRVASATVQRVEHLAPASTRRTFLAPEALYGEYDITLGATTIKIDPREHRVLITQSPSADNQTATNNNIALLIRNYRAIVGPVENVAGRRATTVSLVNKHTGERTMRLWIDNATKVVLAKEAYHQDGSLAWRMRFDAIRFTGAIPSGIFSPQVPSGFQEIAGHRFADMTADVQRTLDEAGFTPVWPRSLPDGFTVIGAAVSRVNGIRNLHLLYSDGIRSLSLFENDENAAANFGGLRPLTTHFEGHTAQYVENGPTTLLSWREHGLAFALVGDLDLRELTAIAVSVIP